VSLRVLQYPTVERAGQAMASLQEIAITRATDRLEVLSDWQEFLDLPMDLPMVTDCYHRFASCCFG